MNNQSERHIQPADTDSEPDLIHINSLHQVQDSPCFLSKFLFLHHLTLAIHYLLNPISNSSLLKYTKEYDQFIPTTRLRDIAMQKNLKGEKFQAFSSIIETQLGAVVVIVVLSLLVSGCSVVTIYYQQSLVLKIITQVNDEQYKFVGIVVGLVFARFILFNYLIALTANVALNIKVHLENLYMRVIFMVDNREIHTPINKFRFLDIESVQEGFIFLPYVLVSFFTVLGVIVLIFVLDGRYAFIVLGIFLLFLLALLFLLVVTYRELKTSEDRRIKITKKSKYLFQSLLSMLFQNLTSALLKKLQTQKEQSIKENRFVNCAYSFIQLATDSAIVVPVVIYYGLLHNKTSDLTLQNTYLTAVYLGMTYFLLKVFVFGCFYLAKAVQNYWSLIEEMQLLNKERVKDLNKNVYSQNSHAFCEDIGSCFEYQYDLFHMPRYISKQSIKLQKELIEKGVALQKQQQNDNRQLHLLLSCPNTRQVVLCSGVESEAAMQFYLDKLKQQISKNYTLAVIDEKQLLAPESYRDNIILYKTFDEEASKKLTRILELTDLAAINSQAHRSFGSKLSGSLAKVYTWHTARLELARALYQEVDFLILDKFTLTQDSHLMRKLVEERRKTNKFTILVNRNNFQLLKIADKISLFIPGSPRPQTNTFDEIVNGTSQKWLQVFRALKTSLVEKYSSSEHFKEEYLQLSRIPPRQIVIATGNYFSFFSLAHSGAAMIIILVFAAPPCLKFYMAYLIGQSLKQDIFESYLIFGVIYLFLVLLRGLVLTGYLGEATEQLFKQTIASYSQFTGTQILSTYKNKDSTIEADFSNIDNHFLMNFEMGLSGTLETLISIIIAGVGQPIFLAISLPVVLVSFIFTGIYIRLNRGLQKLKARHIKHVKNFVNFCTIKSKQLLFLRKYQEIETRFVELNRISLLFAANQMWILSGVRMLGQLVFLIGFVIFLVIMVQTQADKITNLPMVSLGVSLFLNLNLGFRFSINNIRLLEAQLLSISKIKSRLKEGVLQDQQVEPLANQNQIVSIEPERPPLQRITYNNLMVKVDGDAWLQPLQFTIDRGDRISVSYDSRALAHIIFFALNPQVIGSNQSGDIFINGNIHINSYKLNVFYLHSSPLIPFKGNVLQACRFLKNNLQEQSLQKQLSSFFEQIGIRQLFDCKTEMSTMPLAFRQIFNVFKVIWLKQCDVLVVMSGLDEVDTISRIAIENYLVKSSIPVVVSITNIASVCNLYKKQLQLRLRKLRAKEDLTSSVGDNRGSKGES